MEGSGLRFKIDENLPLEFKAMLVHRGHDAVRVRDQAMGGAIDDRVAHACQGEGRAIVTLDLDFSDIRIYPPESYAGIIVLRTTHQAKRHLISIFTKVLDCVSQEPLSGRLWVASEGGLRMRGRGKPGERRPS